jgi:uncharacterized protein YraI
MPEDSSDHAVSRLRLTGPTRYKVKATMDWMTKMRASYLIGFGALLLGLGLSSATAEPKGYYTVVGVEDEDMLKMRAGPGIGYRIIVGLPNGTQVWLQSCERSGNTSWCKVSLREARGLKGYVSAAYLQRN